jgi:hypothetical protein
LYLACRWKAWGNQVAGDSNNELSSLMGMFDFWWSMDELYRKERRKTLH